MSEKWPKLNGLQKEIKKSNSSNIDFIWVDSRCIILCTSLLQPLLSLESSFWFFICQILVGRKLLYPSQESFKTKIQCCPNRSVVWDISFETLEVLLALTFFLTLVSGITPRASFQVPLISKYLLFSMTLVGVSIVSSVFVANIHHRTPQTHKFPPWCRHVFLSVLPRYLLMTRPGNHGPLKKRRF